MPGLRDEAEDDAVAERELGDLIPIVREGRACEQL
jgi:hypothetical protein